MCRDDLIAIQKRVPEIHIDDKVVHYALDLVEVTRDHEHLEVGVSPRGTLSLMRTTQAAAMLAGRDYVTPDDVKALFIPACAHRVSTRNVLHEGHAVSAEAILGEILRNVSVPE